MILTKRTSEEEIQDVSEGLVGDLQAFFSLVQDDIERLIKQPGMSDIEIEKEILKLFEDEKPNEDIL